MNAHPWQLTYPLKSSALKTFENMTPLKRRRIRWFFREFWPILNQHIPIFIGGFSIRGSIWGMKKKPDDFPWNPGCLIIGIPIMGYDNWLVVSTRLKNISQIGSFPQVGMKIKNIWNHRLDKHFSKGSYNPFYNPNNHQVCSLLLSPLASPRLRL